jgi:ABC-type dipeptide/oligopeptide/nickel transport system permease component
LATPSAATLAGGEPVLSLFMERLPATVELGAAAMLVALVVGIPLVVVLCGSA